jgi:hypothetical protein
MNPSIPSLASVPTDLWETRESKALWREKEGWISGSDAAQIVKDMAKDLEFCYDFETESFCTL